MVDEARKDYDEARHDWHANFGILRTPQLAAVHDELDLIVTAGRQDPDRVRGAAVIDALPGLGKTTPANAFARAFDRAQVARHGPLTGEGCERIPVFRIGLTSNTTLRTLNRMICEFYGHPGTGRANAAQLASYALDCEAMAYPAIGTAARQIGAHPSALIHQFQRLERDIGATLYHRSSPGHPMRPTARGIALL